MDHAAVAYYFICPHPAGGYAALAAHDRNGPAPEPWHDDWKFPSPAAAVMWAATQPAEWPVELADGLDPDDTTIDTAHGPTDASPAWADIAGITEGAGFTGYANHGIALNDTAPTNDGTTLTVDPNPSGPSAPPGKVDGVLDPIDFLPATTLAPAPSTVQTLRNAATRLRALSHFITSTSNGRTPHGRDYADGILRGAALLDMDADVLGDGGHIATPDDPAFARTPTRIPTGGPSSDASLDEVRSKLSGLHFAKEALTDNERNTLALAEGLLALIDAEAGGWRH